MKRVVILVVLAATVLGFLFWQYAGDIFTPKEEGPVTLTYWGVLEDEITLRAAIDNYQQLHPKVKITYVKQSLLNYRTRLQTQLRSGQGPDIFRIHNSWLPMFTIDAASLPESVLPKDEYTRGFYPVVKTTLMSGNKVYAIPLEIDGLAMYVNTDILKGAGVSVPKSWAEFVEAARIVTVRNPQGQIQTAGAALGTTDNIEYWSEILALLFLQQPDSDLSSPGSKAGAEVLQFYTSFVTDPRNKTWDVNLPNSATMFSQGKLAFYFAPARKAKEIKQINPNLSFVVAPVPQLSGRNISLGTFWAEAVSVRSEHQQEAWEFLKYLSSPQVLQIINQQKQEAGGILRPYPRPEMSGLLSSDPILGAFTAEAPYFQGSYLNSDTGDAGLNQEMVSAYSEAVNAVLQSQDVQSALSETGKKVQLIIDKYTKQAAVP